MPLPIYTHGSQPSVGEEQESKKPRRSQRISSLSQAHPSTPLKDKDKSYLPSPQTRQDTTSTEEYKEGTASPPEGRPSQLHQHTPLSSPSNHGLSSPPSDTQLLSQYFVPPKTLSYEVDDEEAEGVWGYLVPLDDVFGDTLVLRARAACPAPFPSNSFGQGHDDRAKGMSGEAPRNYVQEEGEYEKTKRKMGWPAGGYLVGRHPECGMARSNCHSVIVLISRRPCVEPINHIEPTLHHLQREQGWQSCSHSRRSVEQWYIHQRRYGRTQQAKRIARRG